MKKMLLLTLMPALAWAQDAAAPAAAPDPMKGLLMNLPMILGLVALFWFGVISPQRKQAKQQSEFISKLAKGDEVVTTGGIIGRIVGMTEKVITLEVANNVEIKVLRAQVQATLKEQL